MLRDVVVTPLISLREAGWTFKRARAQDTLYAWPLCSFALARNVFIEVVSISFYETREQKEFLANRVISTFVKLRKVNLSRGVGSR